MATDPVLSVAPAFLSKQYLLPPGLSTFLPNTWQPQNQSITTVPGTGPLPAALSKCTNQVFHKCQNSIRGGGNQPETKTEPLLRDPKVYGMTQYMALYPSVG